MYRLDRNNETGSKRGVGVCIYVLDKYAELVTLLGDVSCITADAEQLWLLLECPNVKKKIIGCVYRPPKGNILQGVSNIRDVLDIHCDFNKEVILAGDFNINYNFRNTDSFKLLKNLNKIMIYYKL